LETVQVVSERPQPFPRQPVSDRKTDPLEWFGALRLPIAGPYRPMARLYRTSDGELRWRVRLWETDRVVVRHVDTDVLRTFARVNGLRALADEIEAVVADARRRGRR
jgi:hypothetical protein